MHQAAVKKAQGVIVKILLDSAMRADIQPALRSGFVAGVTTNPTLLRRAGVRTAEVAALAQAILAWGAGELHLQVYAPDAAGMLAEAAQLLAIDPTRVIVKIPATPAGYCAAVQLVHEGARVTLTAVYTLRQVLLAHSVGAHYAAIYLGRMRDAGLDALALVGQMQTLLRAQSSPMKILAASIRDPDEVTQLALAGIESATLPAPILAQLLDSDTTAQAAAAFAEDARAIQ